MQHFFSVSHLVWLIACLCCSLLWFVSCAFAMQTGTLNRRNGVPIPIQVSFITTTPGTVCASSLERSSPSFDMYMTILKPSMWQTHVKERAAQKRSAHAGELSFDECNARCTPASPSTRAHVYGASAAESLHECFACVNCGHHTTATACSFLCCSTASTLHLYSERLASASTALCNHADPCS